MSRLLCFAFCKYCHWDAGTFAAGFVCLIWRCPGLHGCKLLVVVRAGVEPRLVVALHHLLADLAPEPHRFLVGEGPRLLERCCQRRSGLRRARPVSKGASQANQIIQSC